MRLQVQKDGLLCGHALHELGERERRTHNSDCAVMAVQARLERELGISRCQWSQAPSLYRYCNLNDPLQLARALTAHGGHNN